MPNVSKSSAPKSGSFFIYITIRLSTIGANQDLVKTNKDTNKVNTPTSLVAKGKFAIKSEIPIINNDIKIM